MANILNEFSKFLGCVTYLLRVFVRFNYSQTANLSFRMDCNTIWNIFGTSKTLTKCRPSGPVFITEIFQKHKKSLESFPSKYYCL